MYHAIHAFIEINKDISVDGGWSLWSPWADCDVQCGRGNQHRYRYTQIVSTFLKNYRFF